MSPSRADMTHVTPVIKRLLAPPLIAALAVLLVAQPASAASHPPPPDDFVEDEFIDDEFIDDEFIDDEFIDDEFIDDFPEDEPLEEQIAAGWSEERITETFGDEPSINSDDAGDIALAFLTLEAAILAELDAFEKPVPPLIKQLGGSFDSLDFDNFMLIEDLQFVDEQAFFYSEMAVGLGHTFSNPQWDVLERITQTQLQGVKSGAQAISPLPYDAALKTFAVEILETLPSFSVDDILAKEFAFMDRAFSSGSNSGSPPNGQNEILDDLQSARKELETERADLAAASTAAEITPEEVAPVVQTQEETSSTPNEPEPANETLKPWVIPAAAALLLAFIVLSRRKKKAAIVAVKTDTDVSGLLEVGRRMTASMDPSKIAAIAVEQSLALVEASSGAFITATPECQDVLYCTSTNMLDLDALGEGLLSQTIQTGLPIRSTATSDPAILTLPAALLLTPIVANGRVEAVLLVGREASNPFQPSDADAITQLAPLIGSALLSANAHKQSAQLALVDGLTELGNRRKLDGELEKVVTENRRLDRPVAFAMIDVDHFKNYNDTNGHSAGDDALQLVAKTVKGSVRPDDLVYRYGGEEFCILLPNATLEEASRVSERVRAAIEKAVFSGDDKQPLGTVTISIGLAAAETNDPTELIRAADAALYEAKDTGRNKVGVATQSS